MKTKLEIAKERRTRREQDRADIIALTNEIKAFNKLINDKEDIDLTELKTQLTKLPELIAEPLNKSLGGFLDSFEPYLKMSQQKQKTPDLPGLLKNLKIEQPKLDLKPIAKEIAKLKNKAQKQSQNPEDFLPYRRVVKLGNKFYFDDNMTSSGSGGGGASTGLTNAELRATPVDVDTGLTQPTTPSDTQPVSATSLPLPSGAATEAKQDDIIAQLQALRGFQLPVYDEIAVTYPTTSTELYTYKLSSSDVATITVTYSDDTKANLTGVVFSAS